MADAIPWDEFEREYVGLFKGKMVVLQNHCVLNLIHFIIQTKYQYSDRELVEQLTENPYYQYFSGILRYQEEPLIDALVLFRKYLKMDVILEANEYMLDAFKEKASCEKMMTIYKVYEQQRYMYQNKVHSVENRIVSITQPWIRLIIRGKAKASVEFGAKFDLSLDENGLGWQEKISMMPIMKAQY